MTLRVGRALVQHPGAIPLVARDRDNRGEDRRQRFGCQHRLRRLRLRNGWRRHGDWSPGRQRAADTGAPTPLGFRRGRAVPMSAAAAATARARNRQIHKADRLQPGAGHRHQRGRHICSQRRNQKHGSQDGGVKRPRCRRRRTCRPAHSRRRSKKRRLSSRSDISAVVRATLAGPAEAPHETNRVGSRHQHAVVATSTQFGQHSRGFDAGSLGDFPYREGRRGASRSHHKRRFSQDSCRSGMGSISSIFGPYSREFERHGPGRRARCAGEIHRVIPAEDWWCLITRGSRLRLGTPRQASSRQAGLPTSPGNTAPGFVEASGAQDSGLRTQGSERDSQCASPRLWPE